MFYFPAVCTDITDVNKPLNRKDKSHKLNCHRRPFTERPVNQV